jgi:hypothetical protein
VARRVEQVRKWPFSLLPGRILAKAALAAVAVLVAAGVRWTRQSSDALLRVDSYRAAVDQVAFWASPSLVLFILLAGRWPAILGVGTALMALIT